MYELYERVGKSKAYLHGSKKIEQEKNPFLEGPCLLCVAATDAQDKSVFGVTKEGLQMARLRVRENPNGRFDVKDFPVSFLSLKFSKDDNEKQKSRNDYIREFADIYLTPLISSNGKRLSVDDAMRNMRNVNIMSYCDGTLTVQEMEKFLIQKMEQLGYENNEIMKIQSQMCMIPIATSRINGKQKSTCISFMDINDIEVNENVSQEEKQGIANSPIKEKLIKYSSNEAAYLIQGTGKHSLKEYHTNGKAMPVCLSSVVSRALQNSIDNFRNNDNFNELTMEELVEEIPIISEKAKQGMTMDILMEKLDNNISYGGAKRLSDSEIELLEQLDECYDAMIEVNRKLEANGLKLEAAIEKTSKMSNAAKECCSDITYLKILMASGYQLGLASKISKEAVIQSPSDREILEKLQENSKDISTVRPKDIAEFSKEKCIAFEEIKETKNTFLEIDRNEKRTEITR